MVYLCARRPWLTTVPTRDLSLGIPQATCGCCHHKCGNACKAAEAALEAYSTTRNGKDTSVNGAVYTLSKTLDVTFSRGKGVSFRNLVRSTEPIELRQKL